VLGILGISLKLVLNLITMKSVLLFTLLLVSPIAFLSQTGDPVVWTATYSPLNDSEGQIIIRAKIQPGWHTYSQRPSDAGPISTTFSFSPSANYTIIGSTKESGAKEEFDKTFEATLYVFHEEAEFTQSIKLNKKGQNKISFKVEYICCNDMMCLPPKTVELSVNTR
jgi:DsbC/DsbD-like thiol-disulfide interchange protein